MLPSTYDGQHCSIARSLELLGERWTLLVIREAFLGTRRFEGFTERLDIARNVLAARLARLVEEGVLEKVRYQERPERFEYRLTEKGIDLYPMLVALRDWGDRYLVDSDGSPLDIRHRDCDAPVHLVLRCADGHELTSARDAVPRPGPGARPRKR
jgi:DNA-binding HxlR family transcriptional regulator